MLLLGKYQKQFFSNYMFHNFVKRYFYEFGMDIYKSAFFEVNSKVILDFQTIISSLSVFNTVIVFSKPLNIKSLIISTYINFSFLQQYNSKHFYLYHLLREFVRY